MGTDIKQEMEKALGLASEPEKESEYQKIYDTYKKHLSGKIIKTPLPEEVHLLDENFPYWIKLQWMNPATGKWQDASPSMVLPQFEQRIFSDSGYRLEDPRRARGLPYLPLLLRDPEFIYENRRHCRADDGRNAIRGKHIYAQCHKGQIKVAFTIYCPRVTKVIVVSSFKVGQNWLDECTDKQPPLYIKAKATR